MKEYVRTETQQKVIDAMSKVYEKLVEQKRKTGGELVVSRDGKIVRIKP